MFGQFFKILSAVILVKITGYALIVVLFLNKLEIPPLWRTLATLLLMLNFLFIWLSFKRKTRYLFLVPANFGLLFLLQDLYIKSR
jgi:hypothetical protein